MDNVVSGFSGEKKINSFKKVASLENSTCFWALFAGILTFFVFVPALQNEFVNWDDDRYVSKNPNLRSFNLLWIFTARVESNWHPVTMLSHAIDMAIWGENAWGHHLTSIVLHSLNTMLVFILVKHLIKCVNKGHINGVTYILVPSLITACLFGIHPLRVESVVWIAERKDLLCAFFFLLSLLAYVSYITLKQRWKYLACFTLFALSLMSKSMAVTLPVVMLILDYFPLRRISRDKELLGILLEKIPFVLLSLLFSIIALWTQSADNSLSSLDKLPLAIRIFAAAYAYMFYLYKIFLPINLAPVYPFPEKINVFSPEFSGSLVACSLLVCFAVMKTKKNNFFSAIVFYYAATLLPVIGLVHIGGQIAADRYTYLSAIGPFMLVGLGLGHGARKSDFKSRLILIVLLVFVAGILSARTVNQIGIWHDSITLWSHQIRLFPHQVAKAYFNRGLAYSQMGDDIRTVIDFNKGLAIDPTDQRAYYYRGLAYRNLGFSEKADEDFIRALGQRHLQR